MCAWLEPIVVSQPGWKSMWTSTIGKARASTQAPADARGKATPAHRPRTSGPPPAATIVDARMQTRLLWRRSATALGLYGSVALGFLASIVAARRLGPVEYGHFTLAIFAAGFLQVLLDLTVEEAMIKYGFRYTTTAPLGAAPAALPPRDGPEDARRPARGDRAGDPCAVRGRAVQRERVAHAVPARRAAAAVVQSPRRRPAPRSSSPDATTSGPPTRS